MTSLYGIWEFNGNGWLGSLFIFGQDDQGNLEVWVKFQDVERIDPWIGVWNEEARQITLMRQLPNDATQTYIGYIGDNRPDLSLIFGGSFTESDEEGRQFGWYAKWSSATIPWESDSG